MILHQNRGSLHVPSYTYKTFNCVVYLKVNNDDVGTYQMYLGRKNWIFSIPGVLNSELSSFFRMYLYMSRHELVSKHLYKI